MGDQGIRKVITSLDISIAVLESLMKLIVLPTLTVTKSIIY